MAINNLRARSMMAEDGGGSNALRATPAVAAAPATTASTSASTVPTPEQWQRIVNGETMILGGVYYSPEKTGMTGSAEQGDLAGGDLTGRVFRYTQTGGGAPYEILDTSQNVIGTGVSKGSKGFFGDLFSMVGQAAKDTAPIWGAALGANYLLPALAGGEAALGSAGIGGAESAAFADMAAGLTPEFGTTAAYNAAITPAAAAAPFAAAAAPEIAATAPSLTAGITPEAIAASEAALPAATAGSLTAGITPAAVAASEAALPAATAAAAAPAAASALTQAGTMAAAASPFAFLAPAAATLLGSYLSGETAKSAAEASAAASTRAAELQRETAREAMQLQERMYREGVERQRPYYEAGTNALAQMQGLTGAMPPAFQFRPEQLTTDPGYGFRLSEGLKALERSAAARGGLLSGGTGKALTRYGQEMGSQEFGNAYNRALTEYNALRQREGEQYNRLAGLAGVGGTTAQQLTSAGQQYGSQAGNILTGMASNVGNIGMRQGETAANALLTQGSSYQRGLGDIASLYAKMYGPQQPTYVLPYAPPGG